MGNKQKVYLVRQTQPVDYYERYTIYVCSTKEKAQEYARTLNKKYGFGVKFTDEGDFYDLDSDYDYNEVHYYDVAMMEVDEKLVMWQKD